MAILKVILNPAFDKVNKILIGFSLRHAIIKFLIDYIIEYNLVASLFNFIYCCLTDKMVNMLNCNISFYVTSHSVPI